MIAARIVEDLLDGESDPKAFFDRHDDLKLESQVLAALDACCADGLDKSQVDGIEAYGMKTDAEGFVYDRGTFTSLLYGVSVHAPHNAVNGSGGLYDIGEYPLDEAKRVVAVLQKMFPGVPFIDELPPADGQVDGQANHERTDDQV